MIFSRKAIINVVVICILLAASVLMFFPLSSWFYSFKSDLETKTIDSQDFESSVEILEINGVNLTLKSTLDGSFNLEEIRIDNASCYYNLDIEKGITTINVSSCVSGLTDFKAYSIAVISNVGIKNEYEILRNSPS